MNELETKQHITQALAGFAQGSLRENGIHLLDTLGYRSERQIVLTPNTFEELAAAHPAIAGINKARALVDDWRSVDILFQLTGDDIRKTSQGRFIFDDIHRVDNQIIESYLFIAIELKQNEYSRSKLAGITREFNRFSAMPVMILFQYGNFLSLAIIRRRLNKKNDSKDVLEKVTLIKDIQFAQPHRAQIEILADFHLESLHDDFKVNNFIQLARAWEQRLGTYNLTKRFYQDIANWYFAALEDFRIIYPRSVKTDEQRSMFLIRLLTRLIFCWFLQEKNLIPKEIFSLQKAAELLKDTNLNSGTYYRGILQNLFFATLNQTQAERKFRSKALHPSGRNGNRGASQFYRYEDLFHNPQELISLTQEVPFLNGGLFECLDTVYRKEENRTNIRFDDFSEEKDNRLFIPNDIFFGNEHTVDLSVVYDDVHKQREKTRGLINILNSYKFTIEENTPLDEEIALDPELLGKVFENLLASYNEDTKKTARKSTGSFYTPREIVTYMVDESLLVYLLEKVPDAGEENLRALLSPQAESDSQLSEQQKEALIRAIENVRILDPACGSGAFPMGMLQQMVSLLAKLDPNNISFKRQRLLKAQRDLQRAEMMEDETIREAARADAQARIEDIQHSFDNRYHELDFARKLYLIEDCIYGVDIQPIAIQIAKLRFFITLIVDQKINRGAPNQGVRPLPNLETKLVAANSLIPLTQNPQPGFGDYAVDQLREQLRQVRHDYFRAKDPARKAEHRVKDTELRRQIASALQGAGWLPASAEKLAAWDPYDPNNYADFFEPRWMFGGQLRGDRSLQSTVLGRFSFIDEVQGQMELSAADQSTSEDWLFDIVLGNPPYVQLQTMGEKADTLKSLGYKTFARTGDIYCLFYERGFQLLRSNGVLAFITSNKWMRAAYGEALRKYFADQTNPLLLIDFAGQKIFESATVDVNILIAEKSNNRRQTRSCTVRDKDSLSNLSVYIKQHSSLSSFVFSQSWSILSDIEQRIKAKIEEAGVPLKDWDISINYGIKTGLNEAFIISGKKKDELITKDPNSAEIIRPILRGRDIKRYGYEYSDLWLLNIPWHFPLHKDASIIGASEIAELEFKKCYPVIYNHLLSYKVKLLARNKAETGVRYEWYALQRWGANYWEDFCKQKIVWGNLCLSAQYSMAEEGMFISAPSSMIVPGDKFLLGVLNSKLADFYIRNLGVMRNGGYFEYKPMFIECLPVPIVDESTKQPIIDLVNEIIQGRKDGKNTLEIELQLDILIFNMYQLSTDERKPLHKS